MSWPEDDRSIVKMLQDQQSHAWQACRDFFLKKYVKKGYPEKVKEDVVQSALIKVYQSLKDFSFKGSLAGWLGVILTTTVIDFARQERKKEGNVSLDALQEGEERYALAVEARTPEEHCLTCETVVEVWTGLWHFLKRKSPGIAKRDFDICRRYYVQGQTVRQIAHDLQIKESAVRHALRKAKKYFSQIRRKD